MNQVGEPDAGNPHVRFDERGLETGRKLPPQPSTLLKRVLAEATDATEADLVEFTSVTHSAISSARWLIRRVLLPQIAPNVLLV